MKDDIDYVNKFIKENDGFFDTGTIYTTIRNNFDNFIINEFSNCYQKICISINEKKLKEWLLFCKKMQNVDENYLLDMAIQNKINMLNKKIKKLEEEKIKLLNKLEEYGGY